MRALITLALGVSLIGACFGQEVRLMSLEEISRGKQIAKHLKEGDYSGGEIAFREALAIPATSEGITTNLRNGLGDLLREEGKEGEARTLFNRVLSSPDITWQQQLTSIMGLAAMDGHAISPEAGAEQWMKVLAIAREHADKVSEGSALRGLAYMWFETGAPAKAEPLLRRSLQLLENNADAPAWEVASTLATTGQVYRAMDKLALAENVWTRALNLYRTIFGENHPQTAYIMERLAEVYALRKNFVMARQYSLRALEAMRVSCGDDSLAVAAALASQGNVEEYANSLPAALEDYSAALQIAREHPDNPKTEAGIMLHYAALLKATHRDREAKGVIAEAKLFQQQSPR
jgi:tetratricopeptide (TPR) repeat protein